MIQQRPQLLAVFLFLFIFWLSAVAQADQVLYSYKTAQGPKIDGLANDPAWQNIKAVTTYDPIAKIKIDIKSAYSGSKIFFLVSYPDPDESRSHRSWMWNKVTGMYDQGPDREDVFVFKWKLNQATRDLSLFSDESYDADVWFWKACRTDPLGYADDKVQHLMHRPNKGSFGVRSKTGNKMFIQRRGDAGLGTYKTRILIEHVGDKVPRFTLRQPSGSRADIRAKGSWYDGRWTIEFARPLVTGNHDDVNFHPLDTAYGFGVSRFEIAGRPPEPASDQPLYGSGDITESLTLKFQ